MHDTTVAVIIVKRHMLGASIVPKGEGTNLPSQTAGELGPDCMGAQIIEQRAALLRCHVDDMPRDSVVGYIEDGLACLAVWSDQRMYSWLCGPLWLFQFALHRCRTALLLVVEVEGLELGDSGFHAVR